MPSITFDIGTRELNDHSLQVEVCTLNENETPAYLCEFKIPLWKILKKDCSVKKVKVTDSDSEREVDL